jgi:hypothetical protein
MLGAGGAPVAVAVSTFPMNDGVLTAFMQKIGK